MTVSRHQSDLYLIICTVLQIINGVADICMQSVAAGAETNMVDH